MGIRRWVASKDTVISNAFSNNLRTRMTGSNFGNADSLEIFNIYAQASTSSLSSSEKARTLVQFPIDQVVADRTAGNIPASGSVNFYLRLFNVTHPETLPRNFNLVVAPVSRSWEEGNGMDLENGRDITRNGEGSNWINAASASSWTNQGGDYFEIPRFEQQFPLGHEDLMMDVSALVEEWISGLKPNWGVGVFITSSQENSNISHYTKKFSARGSEFFFKRPIIEARWNSTVKDQRDNFYISSSALTSANNVRTIFMYNYVDDTLTNLPIGVAPIYVQVYNSSSGGTLLTTSPNPVTGGWTSTGVYTASFALVDSSSICYDRWFAGPTYYYTGSFVPKVFGSSMAKVGSRKYITNITNLKQSYLNTEIPRLKLFVRPKKWNPNIYTISNSSIENTIIDNAYFKILRLADNNDIINYGTGSFHHTRLSYDKEGNFFDFDMSMLEPGYSYAFKFVFKQENVFEEQSEIFKFKVEDV